MLIIIPHYPLFVHCRTGRGGGGATKSASKAKPRHQKRFRWWCDWAKPIFYLAESVVRVDENVQNGLKRLDSPEKTAAMTLQSRDETARIGVVGVFFVVDIAHIFAGI